MSGRVRSITHILPAPARRTTCFPRAASSLRLHESAMPTMPLGTAQSRLKAAFEATLAQLPPHAQASLRAFWRSGTAVDTGRRKECRLVLVEPSGSRIIGTNALAATSGFDFRFLYPFVAIAPEAILRAVVAHELAHAFLRANGQERETVEGEEHDARTVVLAWGFDEAEVDLWSAENAFVLSEHG